MERDNVLPLHGSEGTGKLATRQRKGARNAAPSRMVAEKPGAWDELKKERASVSLRQQVVNVCHRASKTYFFRRQSLFRAIQWTRQHPRHVIAACFIIAVIIRPSITWKWYVINFGHNYLLGGSLGRRIERWSTRQLLQQKLRREKDEMQSLGIEYTPKDLEDEPFRALNLNFDTAFRTLLVQRERRAKTLATLELEATKKQAASAIPRVLFVPQNVHWVPPRPGSLVGLKRIFFDDDERRQGIIDWCPDVYQGYEKASPLEKIHLWAICSVFYFGGVFVGDRIQSPFQDDTEEQVGHNQREAEIAFVENRISRLSAPPRHAFLKHLLRQIAQADTITTVKSLFARWFASKQTRLRCTADHCKEVLATDMSLDRSKDSATSFLLAEYPARLESVNYSEKRSVSITKPTFQIEQIIKRPIEAVLQERAIRPSWICMRCLMMPTHGKLSKCTEYCNPFFGEIVCGPSPDDSFDGDVAISIHGSGPPDLEYIPKVIHQTWFEEVNLDRYPQMARVQNSWKQSGWEYRLYTDTSARQYIVDNFPPIFADAFDVLLPGAYKADFFRYLVLMKEGGIYADVDVLLETNLDTFIRPGLSFFAPRDVVGECVDEAFCLWNGFIGSIPGHPIIIRAVERLVNHILERADVHDMQRSICQKDRDSETWKVYTHPILLLSGPCALGVAMNLALGRPPLKAIDTGWMPLQVQNTTKGNIDYGDALILILDKHDLGGFRFSDPERNMIIASTDLHGLEKTARNIANPSQAERQRQEERDNRPRGHYSKASHGSLVWGSTGIYKDSTVSNIRIHFEIIYN
jgi:hypothetical protein